MNTRWSDENGNALVGLNALVYASRMIGEEPDLVLWGGGNSSAKLTTADHMGREVSVLWVKGSGSDMKTITASQFTPLRLDELLPLMQRDDMTDEEMVAYLNHCVVGTGAPKPSIETLLHAFLPPPHIYHTHADAICTLSDTSNSAKLIYRVYGDAVALVPYVRPGFRLAKLVREAHIRNPHARAIVLDKHGLVTWGNDPKAAYEETIRIVTEAEQFIRRMLRGRVNRPGPATRTSPRKARRARAARLLPILRGALSKTTRVLITYDDSDPVLRFVDNPLASTLSQVGPFTPDHLLHTKAKPLYLHLPDPDSPEAMAQAVSAAMERYRTDYIEYFERHKPPGVTMLDPFPRVIVAPGLGLFTSGKDWRAARIAHDLYRHTMRVILNASAVDMYTSLTPKELCEFEYWPLENFKLTLSPQEKLLSRRVALVTGAAGCIGAAIAARFVAEGGSVVLADVNESKVRALSGELNAQSGGANTTAIRMDVSDETSVRHAFQQAVLAYGGLDILVSNAGIARSKSIDQLSIDDWRDSLAVNATGHFLVCREAVRIFTRQNLGGSIVVIATKNILAPGRDFGAYSASKAAQAQLARVLAIEGGDFGLRVNMVNPDAVFDGSGLWSEQIREARAKVYGIRVEELEEYCVSRNLLKVRIAAPDVAEAVVFLASDRSAKITGAMIPVDGGVKEAFPR